MIKISIIMPVYNKAEYLPKMLKSIINQSYKEFQLIIVDDGSNDGSGEICDKAKNIDSRILVFHTDNNGVSKARNVALKYADGDYIQFVDADDYLEENMLEELSNILNNNKVDLIISGYSKVDSYGNILKKVVPSLNGLKDEKELLDNLVDEQHKTGLYGCVSNKLIKASIIKDNIITFNEEIKLAEDYDFYLTVFEYTKTIYYTSNCYYNYLQNANNSSTTVRSKVDYTVQIKILLKEKQLLISNDKLTVKSNSIIDNNITNYVLAYFYEEYTSFFQYKNMINKLNSINLYNYIDLRCLRGYDKITLMLYERNYLHILWSVMLFRNKIRKFYRYLKGNISYE